MSDIIFMCPECSKSLAVDTRCVGWRVACTDCGAQVEVPAPAGTLVCPQCDAELCVPADVGATSVSCPLCGAEAAVPGSGEPWKELFTPKAHTPARNPKLVAVIVTVMTVAVLAFFAVLFADPLLGLLARFTGDAGPPPVPDPQASDDALQPLFLPLSPRHAAAPAGPVSPIQPAAPPAVTSPPPPVAAPPRASPPAAARPAPTPAPASPAPAPIPELARLRGVYDDELAAIRRTRSAAQQAWAATYRREVADLQHRLQQGGDLDGWLAARDELTRFAGTERVPMESPVTLPVALARLQDRHRALRATHGLAQSRAVLALLEEYRARLADLKKELTMAGKIDPAVRVAAEMEAVRASPLVTAARFTVAQHEAEHTAPPPAATAAPAPPPPVPAADAGPKPAPAQAVEDPDAGPTIYRQGPPPDLPGMEFARLNLAVTTLGTYRGRLRVAASLGRALNTRRTENTSPNETREVTETRTQHRVRLALQLKGTARGLAGPVLGLQTFTRSIGAQADAAPPEQLSTEFITLPHLGARWIYLDSAVVTTVRSRHRHRSPDYERTAEKGRALHGVIVSLFEPGGKLVYQAVSEGDLKRRGVRALPSGSR